MKVLIYQQFHPGHHYVYVSLLLPALEEFANVTLCVTREGVASPEFSTHMAPVVGRTTVDDTLFSGHTRVVGNQRVRLAADLRRAVARHRPDYVLVPSADEHLTAMGLWQTLGLGDLPNRVVGEVGIHYGTLGRPAGWRATLRQRLQQGKILGGRWQRVHVTNPLYCNELRTVSPRDALRISVMPQPAAIGPGLGEDFRREAGIGSEARVLGVVGVLDHRKAVVEMATAVRALPPNNEWTLLLAGKFAPKVKSSLELACGDLIAAKRVVLVDRFLTADAYASAVQACDVIAIPYPGFTAVSSVLLEAVAAGKRVLTNNDGWCEYVVRRFGLGETCNVLDPIQVCNALLRLERPPAVGNAEVSRQFRTFHSRSNFVNTWLEGARAAAGVQATKPMRWEDVGAGTLPGRGLHLTSEG